MFVVKPRVLMRRSWPSIGLPHASLCQRQTCWLPEWWKDSKNARQSGSNDYIHARSSRLSFAEVSVRDIAGVAFYQTRRTFFTISNLRRSEKNVVDNVDQKSISSFSSAPLPQGPLTVVQNVNSAPSMTAIENAVEHQMKESVEGTFGNGSSPSAVYPSQFRMVLLRRALEQHVLLQQVLQEAGVTTTIANDREAAHDTMGSHPPSATTTSPPCGTSSSSSTACSPFQKYLRDSAVITRAEFDEICASCHIINTTEALEKLEQAALVVVLDDAWQFIHLCPAGYLHEMQVQEEVMNAERALGKGAPCSEVGSTTGSSPLDANFRLPTHFLESAVQHRINVLEAEELSMRQQLKFALQRAALHSTRRYTVMAFLLALQIAVVARLTFYELDWDIMEPVTYCFGVFVTIVFYAYYIRHGEECTCDDVRERFIPRMVRRFAPKDFDWKRYDEVCRALERERCIKQRIRKWVSEH